MYSRDHLEKKTKAGDNTLRIKYLNVPCKKGRARDTILNMYVYHSGTVSCKIVPKGVHHGRSILYLPRCAIWTYVGETRGRFGLYNLKEGNHVRELYRPKPWAQFSEEPVRTREWCVQFEPLLRGSTTWII